MAERASRKERRGIKALANLTPRQHGSFAQIQPQKATAAKMPLAQLSDKVKPRPLDSWIADAYTYADEIGEVGFVVNLQANLGSRCLWVPQEYDAESQTWIDTENETVLKAMAAFQGPHGGQMELRRRAFLHMAIAGESLLLASPTEEPDIPTGVVWEFLSSQEIKVGMNDMAIRYRDGRGAAGEPINQAETYLARCWRSHPEFSSLSDSPLRRCLSIANEILYLTRSIAASVRSRLAAGILLVPDEADFTASNQEDEDLAEAETDVGDHDIPLMRSVDELGLIIARHLRAPIEDPLAPGSIIPLVVSLKKELIESIKLLDLAKAIDPQTEDLLAKALERLPRALDIDPGILDGKSNCLTEDAVVMTMGGWKGVQSLSVGDLVLSLDHESGMSCWEPVTAVHRYDVIDKAMRSLSGSVHESLTTMEHRWPVERLRCGDCTERTAIAKGRCLRCWKRVKRATGSPPAPIPALIDRVWTTSAEMESTDRVILGAVHANLPTEAKWSDALVETAAWVATDGDIRRDGRYRIRQSPSANPAKCDSIAAALAVVDPGALITHDKHTGCNNYVLTHEATDRLGVLGRQVGRRFILDVAFVHSLTAAQLSLLLDVGVRANGHRNGVTSMMMALDPCRLDAFEMAAILSGWRTSLSDRPQTASAFGTEPLTQLTWGPKTRTSPHQDIKSYTGTVWCPTVARTASYLASVNGKSFFTGNSNHWSGWLIDDDLVQKHVIPAGELIVEFVTVAYLRPALATLFGMPAEQSRLYKLVLDPSPIQARSDAAVSARVLFEEGVLKVETLLRANGFDPSDGPDDQEWVREFARRMLLRSPALGPVLGVVAGFPEGLDWSAALPAAGPGGSGGDSMSPVGISGTPTKKVAPTSETSGLGRPEGATVAAETFRTLVTQVATSADAAIDRAFELAGARFASHAKKDATLRDRIAGIDRGQVLTAVAPSDLERLGVSHEVLFDGAWKALNQRVKVWVRDYEQIARGASPLIADELGAMAASNLCNSLTLFVLDHRHSVPGRQRNGLAIPDELVLEALHSAGVL